MMILVRAAFKFLRFILVATIAAISLIILYINFGIYHTPTISIMNGAAANNDLILQLRYLKEQIHGGGASDMQNLYPEGYLFTQTLYALALCDAVSDLPQEHEMRQQAIKLLDDPVQALNSDAGKLPFEQSLPLSYGIFYRGWTNYVLGRKLMLDAASRDNTLTELFELNCDHIASMIEREPFPESYLNARWPCDATVAMASLALHDKFLAPKYKAIISQWIQHVELHLDEYGLIPHSIDDASGNQITEGSRGGSQALMLIFLHDIDPAFANELYPRFKENFLDHHMGMPFVREYRKGSTGSGDIDSGPIIAGIGPAASIVGMKTLSLYGDIPEAIALRNAAETFGFAMSNKGSRKYLFGKLLMADVFLAWSTATLPIGVENYPYEWQLKFHLWTFLTFSIFALVVYWLLRKTDASAL